MSITSPSQKQKMSLILEDGSIFYGYGFGSSRTVSGEVVFTTGMTGYPESFTDPSYSGQILVATYPLIGNYGVPEFLTSGSGMEIGARRDKTDYSVESNDVSTIVGDVGDASKQSIGLSALNHLSVAKTPFESDKIHIQGLIVANYSRNSHHWNSNKSLSDWLVENDIPAISGIDTRALTKKLRTKGSILGKIVKGWVKGKAVSKHINSGFEDPNSRNLVAEVSPDSVTKYSVLGAEKTVVLVDCGAKNNIIRSLLERKVNVIRVPWNYDFINRADELLNTSAGNFGILISNGPGDPQMASATVENIKKVITGMLGRVPVFGICLGNQILSLAAGAKTYKLKFGHRGQNQPCNEVGTDRCYITSQNHGFAVNTNTLPKDWEPWFVNANDGTNEGIKHKKLPLFSVQFHPEAMPGPTDTSFLFDRFIEVLK